MDKFKKHQKEFDKFYENKKYAKSWKTWLIKTGKSEETIMLTNEYRNKTLIKKTISRIANEGDIIIDIGCGIGDVLNAIEEVRNEKNIKLIGTEISKKQIEYCKKNTKNIKLIQCPGEKIKLKNKSVNIAIIADVIEHVINPYEVLEEIKRILVDGGIAIITTPNPICIANSNKVSNLFKKILGIKKNRNIQKQPEVKDEPIHPKLFNKMFERLDFEVFKYKMVEPPYFILSGLDKIKINFIRKIIAHILLPLNKFWGKSWGARQFIMIKKK